MSKIHIIVIGGAIILKRLLLSLVCILFWTLSSTMQVEAHAVLTNALPLPDSRWEHSPERIVLTFNERIENKLFYIKMLDQKGHSVTKNEATVNQAQREVELDLPALHPGIYTVTYKVISADGHPVSGSYVITVGEVVPQQSGAESTPDQHVHEHSLTADISLKQILTFLSRILYFMSLLLLTGWIFWTRLYRARNSLQSIAQRDIAWELILQRSFLFALLAMIGLELQELINELSADSLLSLFLGTSIGLSWLFSLALAFAGFLVLKRSKGLALGWIILLLAAKSINGHAVAFEPPIRTILLDLVHLFAAAVWAGGLLYILVHWWRHKAYIVSLLPSLSRIFMLCIIMLGVTGTISALLFLPSWKYALYTQWGIFLMAKVGLFIVVIAVAVIIRLWMRKKRERPLFTMLKVDFALMIAIIAIVGVFTYLSPLPVNEPLHWHEMGAEIHMTAKVSPNAPGENKFTVQVWLPENDNAPKRVQLRLQYSEDREMAPIEVPLVRTEETLELEFFLGFQRYDYAAEGGYLPFPGKWVVEVRVLDAADDETTYFKEIRVY